MTHWVLITGGVGSGKSTVTRFFNQQQVKSIDTDEISRSLTAANGLAVPKLEEVFGAAALDGNQALNRAWMRDKIFRDPSAKAQLEGILHPMIFEETKRLQASINEVYALIEIPVFSANSIYNTISERVLVVDIDEATQISRVQQRSHLSREQVLRIMRTQLSRKVRLQLADDVISNNQDIETLQQQVLALHQKYLELFT